MNTDVVTRVVVGMVVGITEVVVGMMVVVGVSVVTTVVVGVVDVVGVVENLTVTFLLSSVTLTPSTTWLLLIIIRKSVEGIVKTQRKVADPPGSSCMPLLPAPTYGLVDTATPQCPRTLPALYTVMYGSTPLAPAAASIGEITLDIMQIGVAPRIVVVVWHVPSIQAKLPSGCLVHLYIPLHSPSPPEQSPAVHLGLGAM